MSQGMSKARQAWVSQRDGTVTYLKLQLQPPIRCRLPQGYRERLIPQMNEMRNTALLYTHRWQALTLIMRARSGSGLPVLVPAILLWVGRSTKNEGTVLPAYFQKAGRSRKK